MAKDARKQAQRRDLQILAVLVIAAVALVGFLVYQNSDAPARAAPEPKPPSPLEKLARRSPGDAQAMGRPDAPVVMIEYSDFRCPFCAKFARDTEPELIKRYVNTGQMRIEWRDFPIFGDQSVLAAKAGRAAGNQGKFWPFVHSVYSQAPKSGHPDLPREKLVDFARQAGVSDLDRFQSDMDDPITESEINLDSREAEQIGASSTPTFLINGQPLLGAQPMSQFTAAIDQALAGR